MQAFEISSESVEIVEIAAIAVLVSTFKHLNELYSAKVWSLNASEIVRSPKSFKLGGICSFHIKGIL